MMRKPLSMAISAVINQSAPLFSHTEEASLMALARIERRRTVEIIARPMRELFSMLETGEVDEIDGQVVMRMPDLDAISDIDRAAEWVAVSPALLGWADCWRRISPDLPLQRMTYLAERIAADKTVTPRLVDLARDEFEATVGRLHDVPDETIKHGILASKIAWEFERLSSEAA